MRPTRLLLLVLLPTAVLGVAATIHWSPTRPPAPATSLTLLNGERLELATLRDRPVLVSFWSLSCRPCLEEIPALRRLHQEFEPRGVEIIAVAMAYDPPAAVLEFTTRQALPYRVALDLDGSAARAFGGVDQLPRSFVIGPDGAIVLNQLGKLSFEGLRAAIQPLLP